MKKTTKTIVWVVWAVVVLAAIGYVLKRYNIYQSGYVTYTSRDKSFSIEHPRNWLPQWEWKGAIVVSFATDSIPETSTVQPYINIAKWAMTWSLAEVYSGTLGEYQKLFRTFQIQSQSDDKINWADAKRLIFDGTLGWRSRRYEVVVCSKDSVIYTITASSAPAVFDQVSKQVDRIIASWKFAQPTK